MNDWQTAKTLITEGYKAREEERLFVEAFCVASHNYSRRDLAAATDQRVQMNEWWGVVQSFRDSHRRHCKKIISWVEKNWDRLGVEDEEVLFVAMERDLGIKDHRYSEFIIDWFKDYKYD